MLCIVWVPQLIDFVQFGMSKKGKMLYHNLWKRKKLHYREEECMEKGKRSTGKDIAALFLMFAVLCDIALFMFLSNVIATITCIIVLFLLCFFIWRNLRGY